MTNSLSRPARPVLQTDAASAADSGLWTFSLAFYPRPGVAAALEALQDEAALDVNLMLFALWLGISGRGRLDLARADAARHAIAAVTVEVIRPLRELRRRLKSRPEADIQRLRTTIKALELDAERAAQDRLAALAEPAATTDRRRRIADAEANLAVILGRASASAAAVRLRDRFVAFASGAL